MILSFDIGIKNLSYCVIYKDETYDSINKNNIKIVDWGIIQLIEDGVKCKGVPLDKITTTLYIKLHNIFIDYGNCNYRSYWNTIKHRFKKF